jgi:hypothetical protein
MEDVMSEPGEQYKMNYQYDDADIDLLAPAASTVVIGRCSRLTLSQLDRRHLDRRHQWGADCR